ncbi:transposase [Kitasatospora sp. GP82]|uniref:transposase n=1 Tax=Kitasatospora sp. GP82 TaxID=3035089 RepID=UPI0024731AA8|nr:transposase [Kitasatospora sp. GP82]MDH6130206.1 hypothetical protein [Kitasatospora sp. GP82]
MHRHFLARLARTTPVLPGVDEVAFVDIDPTHRRVYGRAKQGAEVGRFKGVRTLHPILATLSTPLARPVIAAVRLRRGKAADARGAGPFTSEALATAAQVGASGTVIVRADSQFYNADMVAACRRADARFSLTVRMNPNIAAAIAAIAEDAWTPIHYPEAFVDPDTGELVSDAEVAETTYTAFTGRKKSEQATARLIVRRVRRLNQEVATGQGELFATWRYHAVFTDSPFTMLQAELQHRQHALIEQVIADAKSGPLALLLPETSSALYRPRVGTHARSACAWERRASPPPPWPASSSLGPTTSYARSTSSRPHPAADPPSPARPRQPHAPGELVSAA